MSRPAEKHVRVQVYLTAEQLEEIEGRARTQRLQRGTYLRDLINMGLEIERDNEATGALA